MLLCMLARIRLPADEGLPGLHQGTQRYAPHPLVDVDVTCRAGRSLPRYGALGWPGLASNANPCGATRPWQGRCFSERLGPEDVRGGRDHGWAAKRARAWRGHE